MLPINPLKKTYLYDNKTLLGYIENRKVSGSGGYLQYIKRLGNLLAVYPLIGDVKDYSGNGYDCSISGGLTFTSGGLMGQNAITASAQTDYVDAASSGLLAAIGTAPELTVSYWAKVVDGDWTNSVAKNFYRFQYDATNYLQSLIASGNNELYMYARATATKLKNFKYHNEGWMHLVTTVSNANARVRHYINGRKIYEAADWAGLAGTPTGGQIFNASGSQGFGTGGSKMAWFAVWGKELAESDVSLLYRKVTPGYTLHQRYLNHGTPEFYWRNNDQNAIQIDYGSGGYDGSHVNTEVGGGIGDGVTAMQYNGTSAYSGTDTLPALSAPSTLTFIHWAKALAAPVSDQYSFLLRGDAGNTSYRIYYTTTKRPSTAVIASGVTSYKTLTEVLPNNWYCVGLTVDHATPAVTGYLNGVVDGVATPAPSATPPAGVLQWSSMGAFKAAPSTWANYFYGVVAPTVIYPRILSDVELYELCRV